MCNMRLRCVNYRPWHNLCYVWNGNQCWEDQADNNTNRITKRDQCKWTKTRNGMQLQVQVSGFSCHQWRIQTWLSSSELWRQQQHWEDWKWNRYTRKDSSIALGSKIRLMWVLVVSIFLYTCLRDMDSYTCSCSWVTKKNTSHGNEMLSLPISYTDHVTKVRAATGYSMPSGAMTISCLQWREGSWSGTDILIIQSGKDHLARRYDYEWSKKKGKTKEAVGRQPVEWSGLDFPGMVWREGCGRQTKMDSWRQLVGRSSVMWCPNGTTLQIKGQIDL